MFPDRPPHEVNFAGEEYDDAPWLPQPHQVPPSPVPCDCYPDEADGDATIDLKALQTVGSSCNVLLLYQLHHFSTLSWVNVLLAFFSLGYFGIIVTCLVINSSDEEWRETYKFTFHMLEFWGLVVFSVVNLLALMCSPKPLRTIYEYPLLLKFLVTTNVVMSAVPAILMTIDIDRFEYVAHNVEYSNIMFVIFVDLVLFVSLLKEKGQIMAEHIKFFVIFLISFLIGISQLLIWNLMRTEEGEQIAHYLEFSLDLFGALTTFLFCLDNKLLADKWIKVILTEGTCPPECLLRTKVKEGKQS